MRNIKATFGGPTRDALELTRAARRKSWSSFSDNDGGVAAVLLSESCLCRFVGRDSNPDTLMPGKPLFSSKLAHCSFLESSFFLVDCHCNAELWLVAAPPPPFVVMKGVAPPLVVVVIVIVKTIASGKQRRIAQIREIGDGENMLNFFSF